MTGILPIDAAKIYIVTVQALWLWLAWAVNEASEQLYWNGKMDQTISWSHRPWWNGKKPKKNKKETRWENRNQHSNKDYDKIAKDNWWSKQNQRSHDRPIYKWKWHKYYSTEKTAHNTDFWWKQWVMKWGRFIYQKTLDAAWKVIKNKK